MNFIDSNIWLYALLDRVDDPSSAPKRVVACQLLETVETIVSTQVINEVCVNLLKTKQFGELQIRDLILDFYDVSRVVELDFTCLSRASELRDRYRFSFWDSLIIASAVLAGAERLYSEDMQHGMVILDRLQVVNPFLS